MESIALKDGGLLFCIFDTEYKKSPCTNREDFD